MIYQFKKKFLYFSSLFSFNHNLINFSYLAYGRRLLVLPFEALE